MLFINWQALLVIMACVLWRGFHEIAYDGTGYWVYLIILLYYGVLLLLAALIVGGLIDILRVATTDRHVEPTQ